MSHAAMGHHGSPLGPVAFVAMWTAMMVVMMVPSLAPALRDYHRVAHRSRASAHPRWSTAAMAAAYYAVWAGVGVALLPLGALLEVMSSVVERRLPALAHAGPLAVGVVVVIAGAIQLTTWKAHHLACCRRVAAHGGVMAPRGAAAWRAGVRLALHCCLSCAGPMAVLLAVGVMDLRAMAVATAAITAERVAADGVRAARVIGVLAIVTGVALIARAAVASAA
jgi:predicted metal-binding membrane protein